MADEYDEVIERIRWLHDETLRLSPWLDAQAIEELVRARDRWIGLIEEGRQRKAGHGGSR
jgi:predicted transcriptional regulator